MRWMRSSWGLPGTEVGLVPLGTPLYHCVKCRPVGRAIAHEIPPSALLSLSKGGHLPHTGGERMNAGVGDNLHSPHLWGSCRRSRQRGVGHGLERSARPILSR